VEGWIRNEGLPNTLDRGRLIFDRGQVAQWAAARGLAAQAGFLAPESSVFATGCRLEPLLRAGGIWRDVPASGVTAVFDRIVAALPAATPPVRQMLTQRLHVQGGITWAPIGGGFALPHPGTRIALGRDSGTLALLLLSDPLALAGNGPDGEPVTRMFFFIAPSPRAHLDLLGRLSRMLARGTFRELLTKGSKDDDIFSAVAAADKLTMNGASSEVKR
jgi:PTS system nitrogen regulatory IIA component